MMYFPLDIDTAEGFLIFSMRISEDPKLILNGLRRQFPKLVLQFLNPSSILGADHLAWSVRQNWFAAKRGILAAQRQEVDLLMRVASTNQISEAFDVAGVSDNQLDIVVTAIGLNNILKRFMSQIRKNFQIAPNISVGNQKSILERTSLPREILRKNKEILPLLLLEISAVRLANKPSSMKE